MAKLSHRQRYFADGPDIGKDRPSPKPIFADGKAIGKPEPSANTNLCRRPGHRQRPTIGKIGPGQTPADAGRRRALCRWPCRQAVGKREGYADGRGHRQRQATWPPQELPGPPSMAMAGHRQTYFADGLNMPSA